MKILHMCLQAPYMDYWGYQDNLLPKYHKKMGLDVTVLTTNNEFNKGKIVETKEREYYLSDGEKIIRRAYRRGLLNSIIPFVKIYKIVDVLDNEKPDIVFVHGIGNLSVIQVAKYIKKNKNCKVLADNHLDYYNESPELKKSRIKRSLIIRVFKLLNRYMQRYYIKVYGVTPWRVKYEEDVFGIRKGISDLLVLGADDEKINYDNKDAIKKEIRGKYGIDINSFLITTGGKITREKNIHLLIEAVNSLKNVCLLVFGDVDESTLELLPEDYDSSRIKLIGWIDSDKVYDLFLASDLVVFPGTHSVLWEQSCACGIPGVFKYWDGMNHVDVGGNCQFLYNDSANEIATIIEKIISDSQLFCNMKSVAENIARFHFLYSNIAKKTIDDALQIAGGND